MQFNKTIKNLPNKDREKILNGLNRTRRVAVVLQRNGHLRVSELEKYLTHQKLMSRVIQEHKPWIKRQKSILGPIGSKPLGAPKVISRESIYE